MRFRARELTQGKVSNYLLSFGIGLRNRVQEISSRSCKDGKRFEGNEPGRESEKHFRETDTGRKVTLAGNDRRGGTQVKVNMYRRVLLSVQFSSLDHPQMQLARALVHAQGRITCVTGCYNSKLSTTTRILIIRVKETLQFTRH